MNKHFIFILILILYYCGQNNKKVEEHEIEMSMNDTGIPIHVLIDSIEGSGSIDAFNNLKTESLDFRAGEFLSTFMIMADKYDNADACMEVYYQLLYMYETKSFVDSENGIFDISILNFDTKTMVIRYLKKGDSLGNKEAKSHLLEYEKFGIISFKPEIKYQTNWTGTYFCSSDTITTERKVIRKEFTETRWELQIDSTNNGVLNIIEPHSSSSHDIYVLNSVDTISINLKNEIKSIRGTLDPITLSGLTEDEMIITLFIQKGEIFTTWNKKILTLSKHKFKNGICLVKN